MQGSNYYFSTPLVNPDCPFGLPNPSVAVTQQASWDRSKTFEHDHKLNVWMQKNGFGESMPNFYMVEKQELMECSAVKAFLESKGLVHNPSLDASLKESFEL